MGIRNDYLNQGDPAPHLPESPIAIFTSVALHTAVTAWQRFWSSRPRTSPRVQVVYLCRVSWYLQPARGDERNRHHKSHCTMAIYPRRLPCRAVPKHTITGSLVYLLLWKSDSTHREETQSPSSIYIYTPPIPFSALLLVIETLCSNRKKQTLTRSSGIHRIEGKWYYIAKATPRNLGKLCRVNNLLVKPRPSTNSISFSGKGDWDVGSFISSMARSPESCSGSIYLVGLYITTMIYREQIKRMNKVWWDV